MTVIPCYTIGMTEIKKAVLGSVRLDSDVWEAVRAMDVSLNVYLRVALLESVAPTAPLVSEAVNEAARQTIYNQPPAEGMPDVRPNRPVYERKTSKKQEVINELAANDLTAQAVGREDIEYGLHTDLPRGEHVANLAVERAGKKPLLRPKERK